LLRYRSLSRAFVYLLQSGTRTRGVLGLLEHYLTKSSGMFCGCPRKAAELYVSERLRQSAPRETEAIRWREQCGFWFGLAQEAECVCAIVKDSFAVFLHSCRATVWRCWLGTGALITATESRLHLNMHVRQIRDVRPLLEGSNEDCPTCMLGGLR